MTPNNISVIKINNLYRFIFSGLTEGRVMVFNATFNNISVISWQSVLLLEETTDLPQVTLSHNVVSSTPPLRGIRTRNVSGDKH